MGNISEAFKSAGFESTEKPEPEKPAPEAGKEASENAAPGPQKCAQCGAEFTPKHSKHRMCNKCAEERYAARKAAIAAGTAEPAKERAPRPEKPVLPEKKCAKCGTMFVPKSSKHRLCMKCADEEFAPPAVGQVSNLPATGSRSVAGFPPGYLASGYFAAAGKTPRDEVYGSWARQIARLLVNKKLKSHQLRVFYNHVKRAGDAAAAGKDIAEVRADVLKVKGYAAERQGRGHIPAEFREFLERNADQVKDAGSLGAFVEHFQAVLGYVTAEHKN